MNANTKAAVLNDEQTRRLDELLREATAGLTLRTIQRDKFTPNEEQIANFQFNVTPNIVASILKASANNDTAQRASRLKAVDALAAVNGVKFTHRRELEEMEELLGIEIKDRNTVEEHIGVTTVNATRGGETIAYKYVLDADNNLSIEYSTAFCRADENFDPLIGKEESLKKFLAGETLNTVITHERFGQVKLTQLVSRYKTSENAALKLLEDARKALEDQLST